VTLPVLQAFSMWLAKQTAWTGGGITAPINESTPLDPLDCFDIEQASTAGWQPATGFTPNTDGVYNCGQTPVKLTGFPAPTQLSDVGKTLADLK